jgi:hypothetical protein
VKPLVSRDYPLGHLLNPATPYEPAARTDIARTFARLRREARQRDVQAAAIAEEQARVVAPITRRAKA